jgi:hypothetical protein
MANSNYPNPVKHPPIKLTDAEIGYKYIEFPEDVFFMESLAQNDSFRDGKIVYVPVKRHVNGEEESHIYSICLDSDQAKHVAGPVTAPDGSGVITIFGSDLSPDGVLYLCAFNRNSIMAFDMKTIDEDKEPKEMRCLIEYEDVPSPNDVCTDPNDPLSLYVCAGTFRNLGCVDWSNAAYGQVYRVKLDSEGPGYNVQVISTGLNTLAGCEMINGKLWAAQLYNMFTLDLLEEVSATPKIEWEGDDADKMVWMADNIDVFDDDVILCPAYTRVPKAAVEKFMKRPWLSSTILFFVQLVSACLTCEPLGQAFRDPEVLLAFSNTFVKEGADPEPIRLIFVKPGGTTFHFEVYLQETLSANEPRSILARGNAEHFIHLSRGNSTGVINTLTGGEKKMTVLGKRHHFNEQVTHAAHLTDGTNGYVACVNFEQPRILLLDDKVFRNMMMESPSVLTRGEANATIANNRCDENEC